MKYFKVGNDQYYNVVNRANEGQIAPRIRDIRAILDANDPAGHVKIVEDEWGDWLVGFDETSLFLTRASDGALVRTPTFHLFKLFGPHHTANARWAPNTLNSEKIQGNGQSFPVLSSGATVDDAGGVNISLVNVDLVNTRSIDITINGNSAAYVLSSAQVITGASKDTYE